MEIISRLHNGQNMQVSEIDVVGRRDIDNNTNWSTQYQGEKCTMGEVNFIKNMKENGCLMYDDILQCFNYTTLSNKQQKAMNIVMTHYHTNEDRCPFFMIIQGTTGIGKSYLIGAIHEALQNACLSGPSPLLLLALIGVVAFNIGAFTIHSKLRIPVCHAQNIRSKTRQIFFLIIY